MQKWEYCFVDPKVLSALSVNGQKIYSIKMDKTKGDRSDYGAKLRLIAQLGQDGWELVSIQRNVVRTGENDYWFKRLVDKS